jgi:hypothetical protein
MKFIKEETEMKVASTVLGSMMFFVAAIGTAQAEMCWALRPFIDVVRVTELTDSGLPSGSEKGSTHSLVFGQWVADNLYNLPVVGAIETDVPLSTPTKLRFNVHGSNHTAFFANHTNCTLDAQLGAGWSLSCDGNVPGIFNTSGASFALIDCENLPPDPPFAPMEPGRAAGAGQSGQ